MLASLLSYCGNPWLQPLPESPMVIPVQADQADQAGGKKAPGRAGGPRLPPLPLLDTAPSVHLWGCLAGNSSAGGAPSPVPPTVFFGVPLPSSHAQSRGRNQFTPFSGPLCPLVLPAVYIAPCALLDSGGDQRLDFRSQGPEPSLSLAFCCYSPLSRNRAPVLHLSYFPAFLPPLPWRQCQLGPPAPRSRSQAATC